MRQPITRQTLNPFGLFLEQGIVADIPWQSIHERFQVDGVIRVHTKDFPSIPHSGRYTHFNLEISNHKVGATYLIIVITQPGCYEEEKSEILPLLNLDTTLKGRCLAVRESVAYADITTEEFQFSLPYANNTETLQHEILWRYHQSLPEISSSELLERGVSITTLEILNG